MKFFKRPDLILVTVLLAVLVILNIRPYLFQKEYELNMKVVKAAFYDETLLSSIRYTYEVPKTKLEEPRQYYTVETTKGAFEVTVKDGEILSKKKVRDYQTTERVETKENGKLIKISEKQFRNEKLLNEENKYLN